MVRLSLQAMRTRFEIVMHGEDDIHLRAAGEEALAEIERLDARLSFYRIDSDIYRVNLKAAEAAVKIAPDLFNLLDRALDISRKTGGAFDITIAPLLRVWGFIDGLGRTADLLELKDALELVGADHIMLDLETYTIRYDRPGVMIDLGAVGKGYAIERAVESLVENGVGSALIHGGTSSIYGIGNPPDDTAWRVAVRDHFTGETVGIVELADSSLSVSAVHGKSFKADGREYGHVIDPRTGEPVLGTRLAAVTGKSATDCDALSTALLVLGRDGMSIMEEKYKGYIGSIV